VLMSVVVGGGQRRYWQAERDLHLNPSSSIDVAPPPPCAAVNPPHHTRPGTVGGASSGEAAVRAALKDYSERLPAPFVIPEIEGRIKDKTPYVVVALQEVTVCV